MFIPTGLIYRDHPDFRKSGLAAADTRGCGAGITFDEAIVQGCYDLIMRDAAALWWLNRVIRPEISADGIDDSEILSTLLHVNGHDRHIRMIDLTTDAGIPVVAAVSADGDGRRIAIGLGCDVDPAGAIFAAIEDYDMVLHGIDPTDHPWAREQLADHCYLMPKGMQTSPGPDRSEMPIGTVKSVCLKTITRMSQDVFVANLSKPGTGLQSVRILAPGLCHTAMRFAVDRLGYGPVASGWTTSPSDVTATNPVPYPFG